MKDSSRIKLSLLLIFLTFLLPYIIIMSKNDNQTNKVEVIPSKDTSVVYVLKSEDNKVFLYANDKICKTYEINPMLLPAEDIISLANGIRVASVKEADSLAEDFDG